MHISIRRKSAKISHHWIDCLFNLMTMTVSLNIWLDGHLLFLQDRLDAEPVIALVVGRALGAWLSLGVHPSSRDIATLKKWPRSYRIYILQIMQLSQYRDANLQYTFVVTYGSPSIIVRSLRNVVHHLLWWILDILS